MGSSSSTVAKDQRVAISGDAGQVTAPQSQIANPFGLAFGASENANVSANVTFSGVTYNDLDQVNDLVTSIMQQTSDTLSQIAKENVTTMAAISSAIASQSSSFSDLVTSQSSSFSDLGTNVMDSVTTAANEIKEPLTKYIPMLAIFGFIFVLIKMGKK